MHTLRCLAALLALTSVQALAAPPFEVGATTGLPRLARVDGRTLAWRPLTLRLEAPHLEFQARVPSCLDTSVERNTRSVDHGAAAAARPCALAGDDTAQRRLSRQWLAILHVPTAGAQAPEIDLTYRAWQSPGRRFAGGSRGASAELDVAQRLGPVRLFAGWSAPLQATDPDDRWRSTLAGVAWTVDVRRVLELSVESARARTTGERDRLASLRYTDSRVRSARWWAAVTRQLDTPSERWRAGLGIDWRF